MLASADLISGRSQMRDHLARAWGTYLEWWHIYCQNLDRNPAINRTDCPLCLRDCRKGDGGCGCGRRACSLGNQLFVFHPIEASHHLISTGLAASGPSSSRANSSNNGGSS